MLKDFIIKTLNENFLHKPTIGQKALFAKLSEFIIDNNEEQIFLLKGYAGTGKTSTTKTVVDSLSKFKFHSILLAPTGRAAKVLSNYSEKQAFTIHKKIYRQKSSSDAFGSFALDANLHSNTVFIVDESSMISNFSYDSSIFGNGFLLDDLIEYVFNGQNCKLILIGDTAQLPPVGLDISPALDKNKLESYGKNVTEHYLTEVIRQKKASGILHNATNFRRMIADNYSFGFPKFKINDFEDIKKIGGDELIEALSDCYDKDGFDETMVITRSNKRANRYNAGIRNSILWREEEISTGDLLMVVKNNYFWSEKIRELNFIANGDTAEIVRIKKHEELYGLRFAEVTLRFVDYKNLEIDVKIILDTLTIETPALTSEDNKKFYHTVAEDYSHIASKKKRFEEMRKNPYFNALQVKFAYAVTCHKAQGGQWKNIFIDQSYIEENMIDIAYLRWFYTALTRATENIYLVNFRKEFFED